MFSLGLRRSTASSLLLTRAFFSLQEPRIPTLVALVNLVLNLFLDLALVCATAPPGSPLATSIVTSFNAGVLMVLLRAGRARCTAARCCAPPR